MPTSRFKQESLRKVSFIYFFNGYSEFTMHTYAESTL